MNFEDDVGGDVENKEVAAQIFDTICSTLVDAGSTNEIDSADKLLQLWVKVATIVTQTGDEDHDTVLGMLQGFKN